MSSELEDIQNVWKTYKMEDIQNVKCSLKVV